MRRVNRGRGAILAAVALIVGVLSGTTAADAGGQPPVTHPPQSRAGGVDNWPTYHRTQNRQGYDPLATTASGTLTTAWTAQLDGAVYGEPLVIFGTVIAVTENDTVYGLSLAGDVLWTDHLGPPVPRSELPCGDIDPLGITGTPIYHPMTHEVYFTAELNDPIRHILFAVNPTTGNIDWQRNVDPTGMVPGIEQQRGAMAIAHGRVWVSFGALAGDCGVYHGWEIGSRLSGKGGLSVYRTPSTEGAGIWASTGPSVDAQGHLFVAPANGAAFAPPYDDSDSVVKLDGNQMISFWAPKDWAHENAGDRGQGPVAPLLFSALGRPWAFVGGKAGKLYLLHRGNLGGIDGQVAEARHCADFAGMAFHDGVIYVPCTGGMSAYTITPGPRISMLWHSTATGYAAGPVLGGGALWASSNGSLVQLDPQDGSTVATIAIGACPCPHFATPTLHGNLVLVGTATGVTAVATS